MDNFAQPYDVSDELDQTLNNSFNAMVGSDPALKGLTLENFFKFDSTDDDEDMSTHGKNPALKSSPKEELTSADEFPDLQDATDFFNNSGFLANLGLPGSSASAPPAPAGISGGINSLVTSELGAGSLDALLFQRDTVSLITPNCVEAGMASLRNLSIGSENKIKPKRKYTKRKSSSGEPVSNEAPVKKRTLSKHQSSPAGLCGASAPKAAPRTKTLAKHTSTPAKAASATKKLSKKASSSAESASAKQTSAFRGVSCCGKDRKWQARIRDANRVRYLGRFGTEVEAAFVYDDAARTLKGERAPTNFIKLDEGQKHQLVSAFVSNNCKVPESMMHCVTRAKGKGEHTSSKGPINTALAGIDDSFPDSPVAKIKHTGNSPAISPSVKSTPSRSTAFSKASKATRISVEKKGLISSEGLQIDSTNLTAIPVSVLFQ